MLKLLFVFELLLYHEATAQESCAQLKLQGDSTSGMKTINPTGSFELNVECDMNSDPIDGVTIVHNNEVRRLASGSSYQTPGSWGRTMDYTGYTMDQIKPLVLKSASCEQYTKFEGHHSYILYYSDTPYTYWVSRDNENMFLWGGGKTYKRMCGCGVNGTCAPSTYGLCNADKNDRQLRSDEGFLTDRARLPVKRVEIGDVDQEYEYAFVTIGPLRCRGVTAPALKSCAEVKAVGFTKTNSYLLDPDGDGGDDGYWAYCDLDLYENEVVTVVFHDVPYRTHVQGIITDHHQAITYWATDSQMLSLIAASTSCQQFFDVDNLHSDIGASRWISMHGDQMKNWGGVPDVPTSCPCHLDNSCYSGYVCNGKANDGTWREDKGYIFNKEKLPMKAIEIRDVDSTIEEAYFRVGPLECKGPEKSTITRGTSCYKLNTDKLSWKEAVKACERIYAHLVTFDNEDEQNFIYTLVKSVLGPLSLMWSGADCTTVSGESTNCDTNYGYVCENKLTEYTYFKKTGTNKSPIESSVLVPTSKAISVGVCNLNCESTESCHSFAYNFYTHDCKLSSETSDASAISEDNFELYIKVKTYQGCGIR